MAKLLAAIGALLAKTVVTAGLSLVPQPAIIIQDLPLTVASITTSTVAAAIDTTSLAATVISGPATTSLLSASAAFALVAAGGVSAGTGAVTPGLLPQVKFLSHKLTGTAKLSPASPALNAAPSPAPQVAATPMIPKATSAITPAPTAAAGKTVVTTASFLNATTLSLKEDRDGPYEAVLTTAPADGTPFIWGLGQSTIDGSGGVPSFSVSSTCNPIPNMPLVTDTDQNPTFSVRTTYTCTIGLAALSGSDQSVHTKQFTFATDPGQFIIIPPSSMDTVLNSSNNQGGFVFDNEDTEPVTVTGFAINVSYTALNTGQGPLVLRFLDPVSGAPLTDYHLENLALDPTTQYTHTGTDIQIPVSFTIPASSQKLLPIELLGVHTVSITGVNPAVTITLQTVSTNPSDAKTILGQAQISWSCEVPTTSYDPNATSGALASGLACQ
ncbi:MAG TPA: hypothetical protein VHZ04_02220 [Candidatus Paceibacterota bacterium]|jgi:hypothetical protein|nr:hypothetical protein [Candidatus Paceibacterota bacterium]